MCISSKIENLSVYKENDNNTKLINATRNEYDYAENCQNDTQEITQCLCPKTNIGCKAVTNDVICKFTSVSL
jgi:hypothetical protein